MKVRESREDYLKAVLVLSRRNGYVRAVDIANYLKVSKPSVSKALRNLGRGGLTHLVDRDVRLTKEGERIAESVLERHQFFCALLVSAGVDLRTASEEACRMEHCLSEDSFEKLMRHCSCVQSAGNHR